MSSVERLHRRPLDGQPLAVSGVERVDALDTALAHVRAGAALVVAKAPEDLADFRDMLVALATAVGDGVDGTSEQEAEAVERIRAALGGATAGV